MGNKINRHFEWLLVPVIAVVAFWVYQSGWVTKLHNSLFFESPTVVPAPVIPPDVSSLVKNDAVGVADSSTPVAKININDIQVGMNAKITQYHGWRQSRGYFTTEDAGDYISYSDDALTNLGQQGDLKALNVLTERMFHRGDLSGAARFANVAVIFGSTYALDIIWRLVGPSFTSKENAHEALLESFAVIKVMEMRGDLDLADGTRRELAIGNQVNLNLKPEEKALIDNRADQIYLNYQAIRTAKGLGDFDNTPSPFAKAR